MKTDVAVREKPIIFSGPMVRAILEGRKTQTRRVVKSQPKVELFPFLDARNRPTGDFAFVDHPRVVSKHIACPYGVPGGRLWVRETWWEVPVPTSLQIREGADTWPEFAYDADETEISREQNRAMGWRLRPSIFMPRWASRITLEVQEVRVQRVQEISEEDAIAEGAAPKQSVTPGNTFSFPHRAGFNDLWDSINLKRGFGWDSNPWVWCVSFKRLT